MFLTSAADVLRAAGLTVVEVPGWKTRSVNSGGLTNVLGGLVHHTATSNAARGDYPSLNVVTYGRSDLVGPLAQFGVGRSGVWYVIAAGKANHAGTVDDYRYSNDYAVGAECEYSGFGPWPRAQKKAMILGFAALSLHFNIVWRGHKEAAVPKGRKPDPGNIDMNSLRRKIASKAKKLAKQEDILPALTKNQLRKLVRVQTRKGLITKKGNLRAAVRKAFEPLIRAIVRDEMGK